MIADKDRSGYIGASDVDKVVGNWKTETWMKWWLQKIGINNDHFDNKYTITGTHYEHRILESLGIPMEFDKQIILEDLKLRVNLDGNTEDCIYECKTTSKPLAEFKVPKKYIQQVQVQMFASGIKRAKVIVYQLEEDDYDNFFRPIDNDRRKAFPLRYDESWVNEIFIPKLTILADCLKKGVLPNEAIIR